MLMMNRREGDIIRIGDNVRIVIGRPDRPGRTRIGIEAPTTVPIVIEKDCRKARQEEPHAGRNDGALS